MSEILDKLVSQRGVLEVHERKIREFTDEALRLEGEANNLLKKANEARRSASTHQTCAEDRRREIAELEGVVYS